MDLWLKPNGLSSTAQKAVSLQHKSIFAAQRPHGLLRIKLLCFSQRVKVPFYKPNTRDTGAGPHSVPWTGEQVGYCSFQSDNLPISTNNSLQSLGLSLFSSLHPSHHCELGLHLYLWSLAPQSFELNQSTLPWQVPPLLSPAQHI